MTETECVYCAVRTESFITQICFVFKGLNLCYKTIQLMLYREIMAVCSQIHTKHINTVCGQNVELYINTQSVPRSKHAPSRQLMLYREIIAVCSQIHTKHVNTLCGQNVELYIKTQSVPRSKHSISRLYKPVS